LSEIKAKRPLNWWMGPDEETFEICGHTVYGQLMAVLRSFCSMGLTSDLEDPKVLPPSKFTTRLSKVPQVLWRALESSWSAFKVSWQTLLMLGRVLDSASTRNWLNRCLTKLREIPPLICETTVG
jgi:hypothetical protein